MSQTTSTAANLVEITRRIYCVDLIISSISGTLTRDESLEKNLYKPGEVYYIDKTVLKPYLKARTEVRRLCRSYGAKFEYLSGYGVADSRIDNLLEKLDAITHAIEGHNASLVAQWDVLVDQWLEKHREIEKYRGRIPDAETLRERLGVRRVCFRIEPAFLEGASDGIMHDIQGMPRRILEEIAADVRDTWKTSSQAASQNIRNLLSRIAEKCRSLEFLGGNLSEIASYVEQAIQRLPKEGLITGADFAALAGILSILSSPRSLVEAAMVARNTNTVSLAPAFQEPEAIVVPFVPPPPPPSRQAAYAW